MKVAVIVAALITVAACQDEENVPNDQEEASTENRPRVLKKLNFVPRLFRNMSKDSSTDLFMSMIKYGEVSGRDFVKSIKRTKNSQLKKPSVRTTLRVNNVIIRKTLHLIENMIPRQSRIPIIALLAQYFVNADRDDVNIFEVKFEKLIEGLVNIKKLMVPFVPFKDLYYLDAHLADLLHCRGHLDMEQQ
ncbi:unnamed protein product [Bursaphelenchus okinawaensis]|uniref:Uncharacterized protein n=1 Tax=Bursaphelenchus okinawaensis TaxID=465554 RepID=A0A811L8I5_9BILA|nr:unnamed protein product [Bursaphelenchus okinawaensis]CAG9119440.1 unnamed protein product [Bursaphelenchus okinawaensis]